MSRMAETAGNRPNAHSIAMRSSDSSEIVHREHPFRLLTLDIPLTGYQRPETATVGPFSAPICSPEVGLFSMPISTRAGVKGGCKRVGTTSVIWEQSDAPLTPSMRSDNGIAKKTRELVIYAFWLLRMTKRCFRRRKEFLKKGQRPRATSRQKIATLLELIKDPKARRKDIVLRCRRSGVTITRELVEAIFQEYELDKKRAL